MEYKCLSREEYRQFILRLIDRQEIDGDLGIELVNIIDRAQNYWDVNIIGINYLLTIIIEQFMKKSLVNHEFISDVYKIQQEMFFTIDELDHKFIDELFVNNLPDRRNFYTEMLEEAKKANSTEQTTELERKKAMSFEEDLLRIIENYYESEIYR